MSESVDPTSSLTPVELGRGDKGKIVVYPFGPYEVLIKLSLTGEFIEIIEVRLNKDFRNFKQKIESRGHHDVNDIYENE